MYRKKCKKCNKNKPITEFYKSKGYADGHDGRCKDCKRQINQIRIEKLRENPLWVQAERERGRKKYRKHGHKWKKTLEQQERALEKWKEKFPEKWNAKRKSDHIKAPKGLQKHHWSYNEYHFKNVIFISMKDHHIIHRFMTYNQSKRMYETLVGVLLDTKWKHENYIKKVLEIQNVV